MKSFLIKFHNILYICLAVLFITSCQKNNNTPTPEPVEKPKYCIMYYASGGDYYHDLSIRNSVKQAALATVGSDMVDVTFLIKGSGEAATEDHKGVFRYTTVEGKLVKDSEFNAGDDYMITNPENLTDFIKWNVKKYPNRKYILAFMGHGLDYSNIDFPPQAKNIDNNMSRSTLSDGSRLMSSYDLGKAIEKSGVKLEAMIAHSCLQGSIEMFADWENAANYLISSPQSIPDVAYDYTTLICELQRELPIELSLSQMAKVSIDIWRKMDHPALLSITLTDMQKLSQLWPVLKTTFADMERTLKETSVMTDPPAITGEPYWQSYDRTIATLESQRNKLDPTNSMQLIEFLRLSAFTTGSTSLFSNTSKIASVLDELCCYHTQSDDKDTRIYAIFLPEHVAKNPEYTRSRFDQLTGWSKFCVSYKSME